MTQSLDMTCDKCRVNAFCPKKGSSPMRLPNGRMALCKLIGGYGKTPLDPKIASETSKKLMEANGPCLTIAEVPEYDTPTGIITSKVVKIFSPPILHDRETLTWHMKMMYPDSHKP